MTINSENAIKMIEACPSVRLFCFGPAWTRINLSPLDAREF